MFSTLNIPEINKKRKKKGTEVIPDFTRPFQPNNKILK